MCDNTQFIIEEMVNIFIKRSHLDTAHSEHITLLGHEDELKRSFKMYQVLRKPKNAL